MADIFISYKKEDAGRVVRIVEGLRAEGFTVWWDHGIAPGTSWDQEIQRELDAAKAVVAVWSEESVDAPWVKEEANVGKSRGALVPVRIDEVEPPLGFGLIQFADLIDWDGDIEDSHWDFFIESVRAVMAGEPIAGLEKPKPKRRRPMLRFVTIASLLAALGIGGWFGYGWWQHQTFLAMTSDFETHFEGPVEGLSVGADIRFSGLKVGEVTQVLLDRRDASDLVVRFWMNDQVPVKTDSEAVLANQTTGEAFIRITPGSPDAERPEAEPDRIYAVIPGRVQSAAPAAVAAPPPSVAATAVPSAAEEAMFQAAQETRLKTDYQDFLRSFPQGFYARRVREEILPLCAGEMREAWIEPSVTPGQMFRAVSPTEDLAGNDLAYASRDAACEAAQADWSREADKYCRAFATSMETRNVQLGTTLADCECQDIQGNWFCFTDSTYSCRYEMKSERYVEVCG